MVIRKDRMLRSNFNLTRELRSTLENDDSLKEIFKDAGMVGNIQGSPLPLATTKRALYEDSAFLAGDRAGLIDLISANGIPQAMISGRLSAEAVTRIIGGMSTLESRRIYEHDLTSAISSDVELGKYLSLPLTSPWICNKILGMIGHMNHRLKNSSSGIEDLLYAEHPVKELMKLLITPKKEDSLQDIAS